MAASDKAQLFSRLKELHTQGKTWKEIADVLREEGYDLTANAVRKRYAKWSRAESADMPALVLVSEPVSKREQVDIDFEAGAALPVLLPEDAIVSSIAGLTTLNKQLLEQIQQSHRMIEGLGQLLDEQKDQTTHTGIDTGLVTSRDLLDVIKDMNSWRLQHMQYIEEKKTYLPSLEDIRQIVDDSVQDRIDAELKTMLIEGGSFSRALNHLVDQRLKSLFSGAEPVATTPHAGPGRGRKGKTHKKFSASLEESLFERVRGLPGQFSRHLANALSTYLSVMEEKKEN